MQINFGGPATNTRSNYAGKFPLCLYIFLTADCFIEKWHGAKGISVFFSIEIERGANSE